MNDTLTTFVPTCDDPIGYISDTYKEINGFRPHANWSTLTYEEIDKWGRELSAEATLHRKQEVQQDRLARKLRRARHRDWVQKKRTYFTPVTFTLNMFMTT